MALELYTRGMIKYYEEQKALLPAGQIGIDQLLFGTRDESLESDVRLDQFIDTPYAVVYRDKDNQSHVREYEAGTGEVYTVPRTSEKTPVGEDLKDSLTAGLEGNTRYAVNFANMLRRIANNHISGHNMTKWKQALDVIRTGIFEAKGIGGNAIGLDVNFNRAAGNSLTADFSAVSIDDALKAMHAKLDEQGASKANRVVIMGSSWVNQFSTDSDVRAFLDANNANTLLVQQMQTGLLANTNGLYTLARYRVPSHPSAAWICEFNPDTPYKATKAASGVPYVPADEAMMFVLGEQRWKVIRGVDVSVGADRAARRSGEIVFDAYHEKDPVTDFVRSQSRHLFLPGNINHTVKSTGSNFT